MLFAKLQFIIRPCLKFSTLSKPRFSKMIKNYNFSKLTPKIIEENTDKLIAEQKSIYDSIASIKEEDVSFINVIEVLSHAMCQRNTESAPLHFPQHASTDKSLRDASCKADKKLEEFDVEISMRKDLYDRILAFKEKVGFEGLNPEQERFVKKLLLIGKRNGLHLNEETREKIKAIKTRMSELSIKFENNLTEDNTKLFFAKEELAGMPDDFINELKVVGNKLELSLKYPHLFPITKKCRIPSTRKLMTAASQSKCMNENTDILEELIELRQRHSDLLGYENHAAYIQEERMAKSPDKVAHFLTDLASKLNKLWKEELAVLMDLKNKECEKYSFENSKKVEFWDIKYYMNMVEETQYAIDEEKIRQYFPLEKVTAGLLEIYQRLLGLKFHLKSDIETWHQDVRTYSVEDAESSDLLGYFFLDLHPREGKFGHAAVFGLQPSCTNSDNVRQPCVSAMMCNFTKPTKEKPALLTHSELETFFHEFGHVMHHICSKTSFSMFSGTRVERDFLEAPSQMLENWVWEKEPLKLMSAHCKTGEALPDDLIKKLAASRKANAGGLNLRQIVLATFDQKIHTQGKANTQELFSQVYDSIMGISTIKNTNMPASFGHLAGGYDAQYYGYLWSEVFAKDMYYSRFITEGLLSPKVGMDYRTKILSPGGSKDASEMLRDFLGRDPTNEAFLRSKGLTVA